MSQRFIGRYTILEEIGRGGMAYVYRAFDPRFKRDVAIKVMTRDLLENETLIARFEREAQTIAALEHPAIVPVYDFGDEDGRPYLVMRLMTGGTLTDRLKLGPVSIDNTVAILERIGSALERAHEKGIIHRDLKPSNIMFDDYGDAFLADFGIARLTESAVTLTGDSVIGTPAYMSPEQIHGDKEIDGRSDIYALGVICFEMLTGQRPYIDKTPAKVMMRHIIDPIPDIRKANPDLPEGVDDIINRTMAKEPEERFTSAKEVTTTLSALRDLKRPVAKTKDEPEPARTQTPADARLSKTKPPKPEASSRSSDDEPTTKKSSTAPITEVVPDAELERPETEVMVPQFAQKSSPETEPIVPTSALEPETEIARPAFAEPAVQPKESPSNRRKKVIATVGIFIVILIIAGGLAGIFLLNDQEEPEPTTLSVAVSITQSQPETETDNIPLEEQDLEHEIEAEDPHQTAEAYMEQFHQAMSDEDYELALNSIDEAIALVPNDAGFYHEKSWLFQMMGDLDMAIDLINQAIEIDPENSGHFETRGALHREAGNLDAALEDHQVAVRLDPGNPYAHAELGTTLRELEQFEDAVESFSRAIDLQPDESWFYGERGETHRHLENYFAAIEDFKIARELNPDESWYSEAIADIYYWELGDAESAIGLIDEAIEKNPESPWLYINRVDMNRDIGNYDALLPDHNRAIDLDPENAGLYLERGYTYWHYLDNPEAALDDFIHASEIDHEYGEAYIAQASIQLHIFNDTDAARAAYERAGDLGMEEAWFFDERASFYREIGDVDAALADLDRCLGLDHEYYWCYFGRAQIQAELGAIDGAISDFERFLELVPEDDCPECQIEAEEFIQRNG